MKPEVTVVLKSNAMERLLNRWKQRRQIHDRLSKQLGQDSHTQNAIAQTLGFCIRELEDAIRKEKG